MVCLFVVLLVFLAAIQHGESISEKERQRIVAKYSTRNRDAPSNPDSTRTSGGDKDVKGADKDAGESSSSSSAMDLDLRKRANRTYEKVMPCISNTWMYEGKDRAFFDSWRFPDDAEHHFELLKNVTEKFRQAPVHDYSGYGGPWIENIFINEYLDKPLSYFNGFVPLFIQWIDTQILRGRHFDNILGELNNHLRPDVMYLAISQGDVGLGKIGAAHPNILVLAAGGFGHVPIPLIKSKTDAIPLPDGGVLGMVNDISFFGNTNPWNQPSRGAMLEAVKKANEDAAESLSNKAKADGLDIAGSEENGEKGENGKNNKEKSQLVSFNKTVLNVRLEAYVDNWKEEMGRTKFNLCPRGYGRSSFRFAESLQMNRIPIFMWDDFPWIPYQGTAIGVETYGFQRGLKAAQIPVEESTVSTQQEGDGDGEGGILDHLSSKSTSFIEAASYDLIVPYRYQKDLLGLNLGLKGGGEEKEEEYNTSTLYSHSHHKHKTIEVSLETLVHELRDLSVDDVENRIAYINETVAQYFTYEGVITQIARFIADPFDIDGQGMANKADTRTTTTTGTATDETSGGRSRRGGHRHRHRHRHLRESQSQSLSSQSRGRRLGSAGGDEDLKGKGKGIGIGIGKGKGEIERARAKAKAGRGNYLRCTSHPRSERCCEEDRSSTYRESVYPY